MHVSVHSLSYQFQGTSTQETFDQLQFEISSGQFTAVIGPSGCGKSTLLRLIAGLLPIQKGQIFLDHASPLQAKADRRIAWMAQSPALLPWLTVHANVALAQRFSPPDTRSRLSPEDAINKVGLSDVASAYPFMLSGGMQQRLALARTLSLNAELWLMDEPFASLDELTRENLSTELINLWQPMQPTVLWITHNIYEAIRLADRVLVLSARPARLVADILINLPRPRQESTLEFQQLLMNLRTALEKGTKVLSK